MTAYLHATKTRARLGRPRVLPFVAILGALALMAFGMMSALAVDPANPAFERTWARTDKPVTEQRVDRTWMWGPNANTGARQEPYADSPGRQRTVQYYDKARMEINEPDDPQDTPWYVTNGLLVRELITGQLQIGDNEFEPLDPASNVNVAGDPDDTTGPTYGTFTELLDAAPLADGSAITWRLARDGTISNDPDLADEGVTAAFRVTIDGIDHQVASIFWDFMWSEGLVWQGEEYVTDLLFENPFYATGYPISEAYWAHVKVGGEYQDVLMQCFERRCLTFTPGNEPGWRVETGNVGQHYFRWRYDRPVSTPTATPTETPAPQEQLFVVSLTDDGETAAETDASGVAYFYVPKDASRIDYQITVANIENVTSVQMYLEGQGQNDDVVATLFTSDGESSTPDGVLTEGSIEAEVLPEDLTISELIDALIAGDTYVKVQTTGMPEGEIQGQISVLGDVLFTTDLSGENLIPVVETDATGTAWFLYDSATGIVRFQLDIDDIQRLTSAHIHMGASTESGPFLALLFGATAAVNGPIDASGTITENDLPDGRLSEFVYLMLTGDTYVDAHTTANTSGEIRGQITVGAGSMANDVWVSELRGDNVVPVVETDATGHAVIALEADGSLSYTLIVASIDGVTEAHIRAESTFDEDASLLLFEESDATPSVDNGILAKGTVPAAEVSPSLLYSIMTDNAYLSIQTESWPDGEIAGSLDRNTGEFFLAELSTENQVIPDSSAPIISDATGIILLWSDARDTSVEYVVIAEELTNPIKARIHAGGPEENGAVLATLLDEFPAISGTVNGMLVHGTIEADDLRGPLEGMTISEFIAAMIEGNAYVNVATEEYPGGEIRGQIAPLS